MKRLLTLAALFTLFFARQPASAQVIERQQCLGGSDTERISGLIMYPDSTFLHIIRSKSNNGDVGSNSGFNDLWLIKTDEHLDIQWKKVLGTPKNDFHETNTTDPSGNTYIGYFSYETNNINFDINVSKLDGLGNTLWTTKLGAYGSSRASVSRFIFSNNNLYVLYTFRTDSSVLYGVNATNGNILFKRNLLPTDTSWRFDDYNNTSESRTYFNILTDNTILVGKTIRKKSGSANTSQMIYKVNATNGSIVTTKFYSLQPMKLFNIDNSKTLYIHGGNTNIRYGILDNNLSTTKKDSLISTGGPLYFFDYFQSDGLVAVHLPSNSIYFLYSSYEGDYNYLHIRKIGTDGVFKAEARLDSFNTAGHKSEWATFEDLIKIDADNNLSVLFFRDYKLGNSFLSYTHYYTRYDLSLNLLKKFMLAPRLNISNKIFRLPQVYSYLLDGNNILFSAKGYDSLNTANTVNAIFKYSLNGNPLDTNYFAHNETAGADFFSTLTYFKNGDHCITGYSDDYCQPGNFQVVFLKNRNVLSDYNEVRGRVYIDVNTNNTYNPGIDHIMTQGIVKTSKGSINVISHPSETGLYYNLTDTGTYTSVFTGYNNYFNITPVSRVTSHVTYGFSDSADFALQPKGTINDLRITLINTWVTRPGFTNSYEAVYTNEGTTVINNGTVAVVLDSRLAYNSAVPSPISIAGDTLKWNLASLNPSQSGKIKINFTGKTPPTLNDNDSLLSKTWINPVVTDSTPTDNYYVLTDIARNSFDPNDKNIENNAQLTPAQINNGEFITYRIRFQNTGNYPATHVIIHDTLENNLDWATLQIITTSHTGLQTSVKNGNIIEFRFSNINLPASSVNEPASHGFVVFKIKPKKPLTAGTQIKNRAHITFDFNIPVTTNTATAKVIQLTGLNWGKNTDGRLSIYPNPNPGDFIMEFDSPFTGNAQLHIFDLTGKLVCSQSFLHANKSRVQLHDNILPAGYYNMVIRAGNDTWNQQFMIIK